MPKSTSGRGPSKNMPKQRSCGTMPVHERLLRTAPGYRAARDASENRAMRAAMLGVAGRSGCTKIPVVVHVVHNTPEQNISDEQIESQIEVLTADFRKKNADIGSVPAVFAPLAADARIEFELADVDPDGNATDGITRTATAKTEFVDDDSVKFSSSGGHDAWPSDHYLNIWVCPLGDSLLGYAQFPGGPAETDGVVILHSAFGTTGTAAAPFDRGRTATHEVGHWLDLRHIWGDDGTGCAGDDFVADTPNQGGANVGKPTFPSVSCGNGPNGDMFMNYMDYVDDAAMMMFTAGQVTRMQAALDSTRSAIGTSIPCGGKPLPKEPIKELPKEPIKEFPKDGPKDFPKEPIKELPKEPIKEFPKDGPKDFPKEPIKEFVKDLPKDPPKDLPKDGIKDFPKEFHKDPIQEPGKSLFADNPPKSITDPPKSFFEPPVDFPFGGGFPGVPGRRWRRNAVRPRDSGGRHAGADGGRASIHRGARAARASAPRAVHPPRRRRTARRGRPRGMARSRRSLPAARLADGVATRMILIVSHPNNGHVDAVRRHLHAESVVVDTASFPKALGLAAALSNGRECLELKLPSSEALCLCKVGAVWYRRISPYGFHEDLTDSTAQLFAWSETNEALLGVWYSMGCFWMNPPTADEVAQRKIRQLQVARRVGLSIPDTLVTNEPETAEDFVSRHGVGSVVRKAFRNIAQAPRETLLMRAEDVELLDSVRYAPVIFQRYVPADLDLRVTVVEDDIFAASFRSEAQYAADYRPGIASAKTEPYELPPQVAEKLLQLMRAFDLQYGAIDLRVTPDGDHVFLEVNPAGEYLFVSERTGQPIPAAIAASLERHDRAASRGERHDALPC